MSIHEWTTWGLWAMAARSRSGLGGELFCASAIGDNDAVRRLLDLNADITYVGWVALLLWLNGFLVFRVSSSSVPLATLIYYPLPDLVLHGIRVYSKHSWMVCSMFKLTNIVTLQPRFLLSMPFFSQNHSFQSGHVHACEQQNTTIWGTDVAKRDTVPCESTAKFYFMRNLFPHFVNCGIGWGYFTARRRPVWSCGYHATSVNKRKISRYCR